ncbi:MAG TPA: alkaline phosphatase family protein [Dehalococcoidales bacterium]
MKNLRASRAVLGLSLAIITILMLVLAFGCSTTPPATPTATAIPSPVPTATPTPPRNVVLIGWDAAERSQVKESLSQGKLPNLQKLSSEGTMVAIDMLRTTDTASGWTQILTGYEPEVTGVFANDRTNSIPKGFTVFERLEQYFGPQNFVTVAVISKKGNMESDPGKPYYYTKDSMDVFINGLEEDDNVVSKTLELLGQYKDKPFFFFVHFAAVDNAGHQYAEGSQQYKDAFISYDTHTGMIVQKLKELNLYDRTLVYVTADHGFDVGQKNHHDAPYVFLATNDPLVMRRGLREDIAPTILDRFGLDLSKINPPLDGHPLTKPYQLPLW